MFQVMAFADSLGGEQRLADGRSFGRVEGRHGRRGVDRYGRPVLGVVLAELVLGQHVVNGADRRDQPELGRDSGDVRLDGPGIGHFRPPPRSQQQLTGRQPPR